MITNALFTSAWQTVCTQFDTGGPQIITFGSPGDYYVSAYAHVSLPIKDRASVYVDASATTVDSYSTESSSTHGTIWSVHVTEGGQQMRIYPYSANSSHIMHVFVSGYHNDVTVAT